ncbi:hypothetical protein D3C71_1603170 [compost metagenome]
MGLALFGTLPQQGLHIDHQHHAVQCPTAAVARQPVEQVRPEARMGAGGQYRFDLALGARLLLITDRRLRVAEKFTRRIDQHRLVTNPPIHRIGQLLFLVHPDPGLGHMG